MLSRTIRRALCHEGRVGTILRPRQAYPHFTAKAVVDGKITSVDTKALTKDYLVTIFYPFDFTFVCPTELTAFSDAAAEFAARGAGLVAVSTDSVHSHLQWSQMPREQGGLGKLEFPLVADFSKKISRSFGFLVEDEHDDLFGAPLRGLVLSDKSGVVKHVQANDAPVGRSTEETLRLIDAFTFAAKNGQVCPANWKKGAKTITPDHAKKTEYFKNPK